MRLEDLTAEQRTQIAGKSPEEILALVEKEGLELTDQELEQVAGGWGESGTKCPKCGSGNVVMTQPDPHSAWMVYDCVDCGHHW